MPDKEITYVPARYVGQNRIRLHSPARNADGSRRMTLDLSQGDVILMPEDEVKGYTRFDPREGGPSEDLRPGRRIKPEHIEHRDDERALSILGYTFHGGRTDFGLVVEDPPVVEAKPAKGGKAS